ncbi:hypothetical protein PspLS_06919 [Pyricularia sp. CBS 133598]|nr:hypothetical protein PspLS_06919 [Pyricularia sp. CBS 133598]
MRASFFAIAVAAIAVQAAPATIEARDDVATADPAAAPPAVPDAATTAAAPVAPPAIPAACAPTPGIETVALYNKVFAFQKAYLFDKNNNETFKYYAADFQSIWRRGSYTRDQFWATDNVQTWMGVSSYPTDSSFKDNRLHVAYDLGVNRTGHAGDDFVWKDGCIISQQQTPA